MITILLIGILWIRSCSSDSYAASPSIQVFVDKHNVAFSIQPELKNGVTLVQMRPLFEALGIQVTWDGSTQTIKGKKDNHQFTLVIGKNTAEVDGKQVKLDRPASVVNGHTLVPLRFVGEATGAVVGWNGNQRTIGVYSQEYINIRGLTKSQAEAETKKGLHFEETVKSKLSGLYGGSSLDLLGTNGCNGVCFDYFYFVDDQYVIEDYPDGGWDSVSCPGSEECVTYELKNNTLTLGNGDTYSIDMDSSPKSVEIDGTRFFSYEPLLRPKLSGHYSTSGYTSMPGGTGLAHQGTMIFSENGNFVDMSWVGVISDGTDLGDGTGVSTTFMSDDIASGTYIVINHTIVLKYRDGTVKQYLFFQPELNNRMLRIGGRDYLLSKRAEDVELDTEPYADKLVTEKMAEKTVFSESTIKRSKSVGDLTFEQLGYQWANLKIDDLHKAKFAGFGDSGVVSLTVKYSITNESDQAIKLNTISHQLDIDQGRVLETSELAPSSVDTLKSGESSEKMVVFLFPADQLDELTWFQFIIDAKAILAGNATEDEGEVSFIVYN